LVLQATSTTEKLLWSKRYPEFGLVAIARSLDEGLQSGLATRIQHFENAQNAQCPSVTQQRRFAPMIGRKLSF
jgi:hypothetical protein